MLVRRLCLGDGGGAAQAQDGGVAVLPAGQGLEAAVDFGVDAADEEGGHAGHAGQLRRPVRRHEGLETAQVRLHHLVVAVEPEDQRDVDAVAVANEGLDGRDALAVAGTFTKRLGWSMRWWSMRASRTVPSVSWASAGDTSRDTKPSSRSLSS